MAVHDFAKPEYAVTSFFSIDPRYWDDFYSLNTAQQSLAQEQVTSLSLDLVRCLFAARDGLLAGLAQEGVELAELIHFLEGGSSIEHLRRGPCSFLLRRLVSSLSLEGVAAVAVH